MSVPQTAAVDRCAMRDLARTTAAATPDAPPDEQRAMRAFVLSLLGELEQPE